MIRDAAETARPMFGHRHHVLRDGRAWRLGADADAAWINDRTSAGNTITSAIPPIFASYCTLELPEANDPAELARHEQAVIELLIEQTPEQDPWWLGYLDTGASDVVFPFAPRTTVYSGYGYVLVEAGPQQAAGWREEGFNRPLPQLRRRHAQIRRSLELRSVRWPRPVRRRTRSPRSSRTYAQAVPAGPDRRARNARTPAASPHASSASPSFSG